ncbi:ubiquitin-like domain-containing protein [Zafaria sp. J156]|uniref:ubiquitin-like domain-containing protein n=1 Tax=Zafaria sp. J156 TaxID=3116490 RepID=UPI002E780C33|nr:ubiquitin-like domain-containing protein [Zafaria sp. J156]MEE1619964.1 ubiquitin-like domain-containing protein [Zafaria sp. J156]
MQHALKNRWVQVGAQAAVLSALILGLVSFVGANKTVALVVDGETQSVSTFGTTVADVLEASEIELAARDEVSPALDAAIENGATIEVNRSKAIDVSIDGVDRVVHTTGLTVADVLDQLKVADSSDISAGIELELASLSTPIEITTPKAVALAVDGKTVDLSTTAATVADVLAEADVTLGKDDELTPAAGTEVADGLDVKVVRVATEQRTSTEAVAHGTARVKDGTLEEGKTKVVAAGKDGVRTLVHEVVLKDGKEASSELVSSTVTTAAVDEKIAVGTKKKPAPKPAQASSSSSAGASSGGTTASAAGVSSTWAALAKCESGGNWSINTGNGYYGGLQFNLRSWQGAGGTQYAAYPHQATPAQQIATAERLRANGGWGHWPSCARKLGLL